MYKCSRHIYIYIYIYIYILCFAADYEFVAGCNDNMEGLDDNFKNRCIDIDGCASSKNEDFKHKTFKGCVNISRSEQWDSFSFKGSYYVYTGTQISSYSLQYTRFSLNFFYKLVNNFSFC